MVVIARCHPERYVSPQVDLGRGHAVADGHAAKTVGRGGAAIDRDQGQGRIVGRGLDDQLARAGNLPVDGHVFVVPNDVEVAVGIEGDRTVEVEVDFHIIAGVEGAARRLTVENHGVGQVHGEIRR